MPTAWAGRLTGNYPLISAQSRKYQSKDHKEAAKEEIPTLPGVCAVVGRNHTAAVAV
jgi:hypothetical protein